MKDYGYDALMRFFEFAADKGLMNPTTARALKQSVARVESFLSEEQRGDVRAIDADVVFDRFANKNPHEYSPKSMTEYRRRLHRAIKEFAEYTDDPAGYRPKSRTRGGGTNQKNNRAEAGSGTEKTPTIPVPPPPATVDGALRHRYPLTDGFLAELVLPRELKSDDARRLGAFIKTLAKDFLPE